MSKHQTDAANTIETNMEKSTSKRFWRKLSHHAKAAGHKVVSSALELYYSAKDEDTPIWAKRVIYGALIYFISPIDALPDLLPFGYTDDFTTLAAAIATVAVYIKPSHKAQAESTMARWFKHENAPSTSATHNPASTVEQKLIK